MFIGITGCNKHECNKEHYASFLFDNAGTRVMNSLSYQMSEETFKSIVSRCKANGDTWIYLYMANAGDGNPPRTSFYVNDQHAGEIDENKVNMMKSRLKYCREEGLCVVAWLFPDDSSSITRAFVEIDGETMELEGHSSLMTNVEFDAEMPREPMEHISKVPFDKQFKYIDDVVDNFDDWICSYCIGLELNEYFNDTQVFQLIDKLLTRTSKSIGVHWTIGKTSLCEADTLYYQYGFGLSAARVASITQSKKASLPAGKRFIAAEYAKNSDKEGKTLGQAALGAGADGVGNGH